MTSAEPLTVLFYHAQFFVGSETFIYQQAINPHVSPLLLAKRFVSSGPLVTDGFTCFTYKRTRWDGAVSNLLALAGVDRYYQRGSINRLRQLLAGQRIDVIHAQFGFNAVRILPLAKLLQIPLVVSFHGLDASKLLRRRSYRNGLREVFDYVSAIVVCNPAMAQALPLTEQQQQKVRWIPYGINLQHFSGERAAKRGTSALNVLHVGRFVEKKGVPDLIRAFADVNRVNKEVVLHLVGNGPQEAEVRALVDRFHLGESVVFHGWKSPEEVKQLMAQADLFVLNSRVASDGDSEGLPVGLLEAMAMSLPVVSTRHAGIPLEVEHGVSGLLVAEKDTSALSGAMLELLSNETQRLAFGQAARLRVEAQFTMEAMHQALLHCYQSAAEAGPNL